MPNASRLAVMKNWADKSISSCCKYCYTLVIANFAHLHAIRTRLLKHRVTAWGWGYLETAMSLTMPTDHAYKTERLHVLALSWNQAVFSPSVRKIRNSSDSLAGVDMKQEMMSDGRRLCTWHFAASYMYNKAFIFRFVEEPTVHPIAM